MIKKLYPLFIVMIVLSACRKNDYSDNSPETNKTNTYSGKFVRNYFTLLCKISKSTPGFFPPEVSRAYGYVGIANYEAVVNGIHNSYTLAGQLNGLQPGSLPIAPSMSVFNWAIASNSAMAEEMKKMFEKKITAQNLVSIDSMESANLAALSVGVPADVINRSVQYGEDVADAIYQYSLNDGGHEAYLDPFQLPYNMPPDPSCWVPTGAVLHPVSPFWGNNRPFIMENVSNTQQFSPVAFSTSPSSDFYAQAMQVYRQVKNNLTPEQATIAKYWSDDPFNTCTPTGHTFNIMTQLLEENNATLEKTSVAYAKLCVAEMDAFISCWKGKYKSILIRPVSYIKQYIDPTFATVIGTPAFPAFTSGHSCEIGAGSKIFIDMFTDGSGNYNFTDYSQLQYGFTGRTYTNFNKMAEECADSRFYAGIHYPMDNEKGLAIGRIIGDNTNQLIRWPKGVK